ncbi:hypothetical protein F4810DRAFT_151750 [Camillea tinctor]|nr:hypothetical protein F4810DRAFT_151750 [Camillea tinctor]
MTGRSKKTKFVGRKFGIMKKADELCRECQARALIVLERNGTIFCYRSDAGWLPLVDVDVRPQNYFTPDYFKTKPKNTKGYAATSSSTSPPSILLPSSEVNTPASSTPTSKSPTFNLPGCSDLSGRGEVQVQPLFSELASTFPVLNSPDRGDSSSVVEEQMRMLSGWPLRPPPGVRSRKLRLKRCNFQTQYF